MNNKQKYAFLDRDGTIIIEPARPAGIDPRETFPLKSPDEVVFMDGAISGLKELVSLGYKLVLVTNQTFLGSPRHPKEVFDQVMDNMLSVLVSHGISFDFMMVCPHGPDEGCECRKPKIGGLKEYLMNIDVDFENSYMFGDRATDTEFAENLGVKFIKIETNQKFDITDLKDGR
jgi:imidazoleglycerol-phosphate dehydratase / histidinol-phosphatase